MKLKLWGGCFFGILLLAALMINGCEKGALGVRYATVTGRIVDKERPSVGVANVKIYMTESKEGSTGTAGSAGGKQIGKEYNALSNANGYFVIENVAGGLYQILLSVPNYYDLIYPYDIMPDDVDVKGINVNVGEPHDLGTIKMTPLETFFTPEDESIGVKLVLRDNTTNKLIDDSLGAVGISFDSTSWSLLPSKWKLGVDNQGNPLKLKKKAGGDTDSGAYEVKILPNTDHYHSYVEEVNGMADIMREVFLTPVVVSGNDITIKITLRDSNTNELIDDKYGPVTITFDNTSWSLLPSQWRNGIDTNGAPLKIASKNVFNVQISPNPNYYFGSQSSITGLSNIMQEISLKPISDIPADPIRIQITLRDKTTLELIDDRFGPVTISFGNTSWSLLPSQWKNGVDGSGTQLSILPQTEFDVKVHPNPDYYRASQLDISGQANIMEEVLLEPLTYSLILRCTNVPDYITGGVVNIFAESNFNDTSKPAKVIATHSINSLGNLADPNLPELIPVPGIAMPVTLRISIRGYDDELVIIRDTQLPEGAQGSYRLDINFQLDNAREEVTYHPTTASQAGLLDNRQHRPVELHVSGRDYQPLLVHLPAVLWGNPEIMSNGLRYDNTGTPGIIRFPAVPVGYKMGWSVTVVPDPALWPAGAASGSFTINSGAGGVMISPPSDPTVNTLVLGVTAQRP